MDKDSGSYLKLVTAKKNIKVVISFMGIVINLPCLALVCFGFFWFFFLIRSDVLTGSKTSSWQQGSQNTYETWKLQDQFFSFLEPIRS